MVIFKINGIQINAPLEWGDIDVQAEFTEKNETNISLDNFIFVNESAQIIKDHITGGMTGQTFGIFEGLDFSIEVENSTLIFEGFIDVSSITVLDDCKVQCSIKKLDNQNTLYELLASNTFGYLLDQGVISQNEFRRVPYIVEKEYDKVELLILSLATFLALKETIEAVKKTAEASRDLASVIGAIPFSGGQVVVASLNVLINLAYTIALIIYLKTLLDELFNLLYPPINYKKCLKLKRLLEIACNNLGYQLDCNIKELDNLYYFPSHETSKQEDKGIPQTADYGYRCSEIYDLCVRLFNLKAKVTNDKVILKTEGDPFWFNSSNYQLPDVLSESFRYNTDELESNRLLKFNTDTQDTWTLRNFKGTNYQIITSPITLQNRKKVLLKGVQEIDFNLALGNRKDALSKVEKGLKSLASILDTLTGTSVASKINDRIGYLKVSSDVVGTAKLIYLNDNLKLPSNHRNLWCAKVLYNNYWSFRSFVFNYQKVEYTEVEVPFCLHNFLELEQNNFFTTFDNKKGYVKSIDWNLSKDKAKISYSLFQQYTKNLKENYVEPQ